MSSFMLYSIMNHFKEKKSKIYRPVLEKIRILEIGIHKNKQTNKMDTTCVEVQLFETVNFAFM